MGDTSLSASGFFRRQGAVPQDGGGLAGAWTDGGPKLPRHQNTDEAPV